jgi:hypothetical protein
MKRRLTFANVTALLALFFALSAGSYAAVNLPKNSVTTKQVKDHSLLGRDFTQGQIPRGPQGPAGPAGSAGPQGPQGPPGPTNLATLQTANGPTSYVAPLDVGSSEAVCPTGTKAVSGGGAVISGAGDGMAVSQATSDRHSWFVIAVNNSSSTTETIQAVAYCATTGSAVAASSHRAHKLSREVVVRVNGLRAPTPRSYANCTALNKVYGHGVGRQSARDHTSGSPVTTFTVSNTIYAYNDGKPPRHAGEHDLDRDNDGIACEKL